MGRSSLILSLTFAILVSCRSGDDNHEPVIESIVLDPSHNHTPGSDIGISAVVTDRDGDPLDFFWEADAGVISNPSGQTAVWVLSDQAEPFSYETIRLTVSDGRSAVTVSRTIQVAEGLVVRGHAYFSGTTIPVPGVEITLGKFITVSDAQGYYEFPYMKEGNTLLRATRDGFDLLEEWIYVDNPRSTHIIYMESDSRTQPVSGIVRTIDNLTFAGLKVVLLNPDGSESNLYDYTDPNGLFQLEKIPVGQRELMVSNDQPDVHFLNDSMVYPLILEGPVDLLEARIKVERNIFEDNFLSGSDQWQFNGRIEDGFYLIHKGERMTMKEYIQIPEDAEKVILSLESFVVGGCDLVGRLPSHRLWIENAEQETMGGISWGGEGSNYTAGVDWVVADPPTFIRVAGKIVRFSLEVFEENSCVPEPSWRIYQVAFSYYY